VGAHSLEPEEEPWPATPVEDRIESKVIASSVIALALSAVIAVLNGLVADSALLGVLPPFWQSVVITIVPPLLTFLVGFQTRSNRVPPAEEEEGEGYDAA
jgi:hypothetical protein